jgi:hypothetical protein
MTRAACPICLGDDSAAILSATDQPVLLNHLLPTREAALAAPRARLDFRGCLRCGFVWNAAFESDHIVYGPGYVNDQSGSAVFREHLEDVTSRCAALVARAPGALVEVGCGQGAFLTSLCQRTGRAGVGFDPALLAESPPEADPKLLRRIFDSEAVATLPRPVSLIYSRHVLEHIASPRAMIASMAEALRESPSASILLEVPTFDWIARHGAFFDLFNEHCSLFSPHAMREALHAEGLGACRTECAFGGQYLLATGQSIAAPQSELRPPSDCIVNFDQARTSLHTERDAWQAWFDERSARGPIYIWGAGAKGISILSHLELGCDRVPAIVDINPAKQGRFAPVRAQPIIAPEELGERLRGSGGDATILIMNPNYEREIRAMLDDLRIATRHACRVEVARELVSASAHERVIRPGSRALEVHR